MADIPLKLKFVLSYATQRMVSRDGREVEVPIRDEIQNDAATWFMLISNIPVSKDEWGKFRRAIRRLKDKLRPLVKAWEETRDAGEYEATVGVSEEQMDLLHSLTQKSPDPERVVYRGSINETMLDFEDFRDEWKKAQEKKSGEVKKDDGTKE